MSDPDEQNEWVTVAEAAARLGVRERQARRWATKLPDSDRTLDRTVTGRPRTLVRLAALQQMRAKPARPKPPGELAADNDRTNNSSDRTQERDDRTTETGLSPSLATIAATYERVIQEQAARIGDLQTALEHERAQARRLTEALAREQTLRALPAPDTTRRATTRRATTPPEAPGDAQGDTVVQDQAQAAERTEEAGTLGPGNWWARLWRRE